MTPEQRAREVLAAKAAGVVGYMDRAETYIAIAAMIQFERDAIERAAQVTQACKTTSLGQELMGDHPLYETLANAVNRVLDDAATAIRALNEGSDQ